MTDTINPAPTPAPTGQANQEATPTSDAGLTSGFAPEVVQEARANVNQWRAEDALDRKHADQGIAVLKAALGNEAGPFLRVLDAYEKNLTDGEREKLYEPDKNNKLPLNDPVNVTRLVTKAVSEIPILKKLTAEYGSEKAAIESLMGRRGSEYWKGPHSEAIQLRYRMLMW